MRNVFNDTYTLHLNLMTHQLLYYLNYSHAFYPFQRMRSLEDDLRAARASADTKTQDATSARESLVREQGLCAAALERAALSERQLAIAQDRLGGTIGMHCALALFCSFVVVISYLPLPPQLPASLLLS